jgi:hypothetical protein
MTEARTDIQLLRFSPSSRESCDCAGICCVVICDRCVVVPRNISKGESVRPVGAGFGTGGKHVYELNTILTEN